MISATGPVARQIGRGRHDLKVYPGAKHAFFNDQWRAYHPAAAADSWERVLAFSPSASGKNRLSYLRGHLSTGGGSPQARPSRQRAR